MLDRDLAHLYGVETRSLNQAVARNPERFPKDFMFRLTREEIQRISQFVTSSASYQTLKFSKSVTVFTEQGVAMLSTVLNSGRAIQVNIAIMRAFVNLRRMLANDKKLAAKLAELERKLEGHDVQIRSLFEAIRQLMVPIEPGRRRIGFSTSSLRTPL
jgi:hypothetical protein